MSIQVRLPQILEPVKLALIDVAIQSRMSHVKSKITVSCKPACSGCCSRYTQISVAESVIIYDHLRITKKWLDVKKRAKEQLDIVRRIEPLAWFKLNIKCPILDLNSNLCLAYKVRPAICSTHFATSDSRLCDPWFNGSGKFDTLDYNDLYFKFRSKLDNATDGFSVFGMYFVIPSALILAEKISIQSGMDLSQVMSLIRSEL